ncbi:excinuclease ABC subunit UvrC [Candidatus Bathyarchaeota archaeon]|nr:excinuclease ABC subunit UvrC [Candidatus Bathyarchaeota archaeon]
MSYQFNSSLFPDSPGVYLMKDKKRQILYIGKAKSLRKRVTQYFTDAHVHHGANPDKIKTLVSAINDIEIISTLNEREALLLENELIKKHKPPFNVRMRDDKSFPYIMISTGEQYPRVEIIRGIDLYPRDNLFFGPYVDKKAVRKTLRIIRRVFPFCSCNRELPESTTRTCLYYHLGLCLGPCTHKEDDGFMEKYKKVISNVILFLQGNYREILENLQRDMETSSKNLDYERAAIIRDNITAMKKLFDPQAVFSIDYKDMDAIAMDDNGEEVAIIVLEIRDSRIIGKVPWIFNIENSIYSSSELLSSFMVEHYGPGRTKYPSRIILDRDPGNISILREIVMENSDGKVESITLADRSDEKVDHLIKMALKNAFFLLHKRKLNRDIASFDHIDALDELAAVLDLDTIPKVIEGYDISNLQGKHATGSKVCFKNGLPHKNEYRRYKIRSKKSPDDFAMMREVVERRFKRVKEGRDARPDLVVIDGGRGQLNAALHALHDLNVEGINIIGLAKKHEEIFTPDLEYPMNLPRESKALLLLRAVRDESHRFAVKYFRNLKSKEINEVDEILMSIDSIGEKRSLLLRQYFKTIKKIKNASIDELEIVVKSQKAAKAVYEYFHGNAQQ